MKTEQRVDLLRESTGRLGYNLYGLALLDSHILGG